MADEDKVKMLTEWYGAFACTVYSLWEQEEGPYFIVQDEGAYIKVWAGENPLDVAANVDTENAEYFEEDEKLGDEKNEVMWNQAFKYMGNYKEES